MVLHDISAEAPPGGSAEPHTESASAVNFMAASKKKSLLTFHTWTGRSPEGHADPVHYFSQLKSIKCNEEEDAMMESMSRKSIWRAIHESESSFILTQVIRCFGSGHVG